MYSQYHVGPLHISFFYFGSDILPLVGRRTATKREKDPEGCLLYYIILLFENLSI